MDEKDRPAEDTSLHEEQSHASHAPDGPEIQASYSKIASVLSGPTGLPYNLDQKLPALILAISLARSLVLKDIARSFDGSVRIGVNRLSNFSKSPRLKFSRQKEKLLIAVLKRIGSRRLFLHQGKVVVIIDGTGPR